MKNSPLIEKYVDSLISDVIDHIQHSQHTDLSIDINSAMNKFVNQLVITDDKTIIYGLQSLIERLTDVFPYIMTSKLLLYSSDNLPSFMTGVNIDIVRKILEPFYSSPYYVNMSLNNSNIIDHALTDTLLKIKKKLVLYDDHDNELSILTLKFLQACSKNDIQSVQKLYKEGADINCANGKALYSAVIQDTPDLLQYLLEQNVDIHVSYEQAFKICLEQSKFNFIALFLDKDPHFNFKMINYCQEIPQEMKNFIQFFTLNEKISVSNDVQSKKIKI